MVGFTNISARDMLDHLLSTYRNITAVDLEIHFEHMRQAWDPQQPVESLFNKFQYCADYSEAGSVLIGHTQQIIVGYAKIFATGHFMSACREWNEKHLIEKTWTPFKSHLAAAHRQNKQIQGEFAATAGYHSANAAVGQTAHMAEATIGALDNLAMATVVDRGVVATLPEANTRLVKQLEDNSNELRAIKALSKKEVVEKRGQRSFNPSPKNNCWTHGYKLGNTHIVTYQNKVTNERPLERIAWAAVRPTRNDVQGRQLKIKNQCLKSIEPRHFLSHMKQQLWTLDAPATFS
jgi:hypothetical protein